VFLPFLQAKISHLVVTDKSLEYEGSLGVPRSVMDRAGLTQGQVVLVVDLANGERFETYLIEESEGKCSLRGGAARMGEVGDNLIVMSFVYLDPGEKISPRIINVNEANHLLES